MIQQAILRSNLDYGKSYEKVKKSKLVASILDSEKGFITFYLKRYPRCAIQFTPKGKVNIYFTKEGEFSGILEILPKILIGKNKSKWEWQVLTRHRIEHTVPLPIKNFIKTEVKAEVKKEKPKDVVFPIENFINYRLELMVRNREGKIIKKIVKKADK
ncbi:MAG: hypothetical protein QXP77_00440 [Candidatus Aenigmatarchaeota archaeon]